MVVGSVWILRSAWIWLPTLSFTCYYSSKSFWDSASSYLTWVSAGVIKCQKLQFPGDCKRQKNSLAPQWGQPMGVRGAGIGWQSINTIAAIDPAASAQGRGRDYSWTPLSRYENHDMVSTWLPTNNREGQVELGLNQRLTSTAQLHRWPLFIDYCGIRLGSLTDLPVAVLFGLEHNARSEHALSSIHNPNTIIFLSSWRASGSISLCIPTR